MPDRLHTIAIVAALVILSLSVWAMFDFSAKCHADGGTVVRGLVWLECIR